MPVDESGHCKGFGFIQVIYLEVILFFERGTVMLGHNPNQNCLAAVHTS